jgi:hypothetical protein
VNAGLHGLVQLEALTVKLSAAMSDGALCRILEACINIQLHSIHIVGYAELGWMLKQQIALS